MLQIAVMNGVEGAEEGLAWHERNLKAQKRKQEKIKKAKKVARRSRKINR